MDRRLFGRVAACSVAGVAGLSAWVAMRAQAAGSGAGTGAKASAAANTAANTPTNTPTSTPTHAATSSGSAPNAPASPSVPAAPAPAAPAAATPLPPAPPEDAYIRLHTARRPSVPGKIEVIEFFWFGCPHCYAFEPQLEAWVARLPSDVSFRRVHAMLRPDWAFHQSLHCTLEALGKGDTASIRTVFDAIHRQRLPLNTPEAAADFAAARLGIDRARFLSTIGSFGLQARVRQANQLMNDYQIEGVPTLAIGGRYLTSQDQAGPFEKVLSTADYLLAVSRRAGA